MPTKLETYKREQERLSKKKRLTPGDEKRLQQLVNLIRTEERKAPEQAGRAVVTAARRTLSGPYSNAGAAGLARAGAQRVADGVSGPYGISAGQKAKRDVIRQQMGLAPLSSSEFMEPVVDEQTGALLGFKTAQDFEGYRFGPGPVTGQRGSTVKGRDLTMMTGMSVKDVMEFYASLKPEELVKIQTELMDAGLYKENTKPMFGMRDEATTLALTNLMRIWAGNPDSGLPELMAQMKRENNSLMSESVNKNSGIGPVSDTVANITVTDATTLDMLVDQVAVDLFGQKVDPQRKAELISRLQEQEKAYKTAGVTADYKASEKGQSGSEIDRFIAALIGQESGGDPNVTNVDSGAMGLGQIMPENWGPWAAEAGVDPGDFSAANQMRVIKYKIGKYYEQYGNWRDVAVAWYGGAGGVQRLHAGGGYASEAGYPSLREYADSVLSKMGTATANDLQTGGLQVNVTETLPDDRTRIEAELRAADPVRYQGTQFQRQAENFFSLLRGVA